MFYLEVDIINQKMLSFIKIGIKSIQLTVMSISFRTKCFTKTSIKTYAR